MWKMFSMVNHLGTQTKLSCNKTILPPQRLIVTADGATISRIPDAIGHDENYHPSLVERQNGKTTLKTVFSLLSY